MSTFLSYLDNDSLKNKQLQYILQALFQTFFSNKISEVESRYLLCSILGTRYKVDRISLEFVDKNNNWARICQKPVKP